jgi:uncharacterized protein (TIGR02145 family)
MSKLGTNGTNIEQDSRNQSSWGAFSAFKREKDAHGDSTHSFSVFSIFFILLALLGIGYYTYFKAYGAATITSVPITVNLNSGLVAHWTFDTSAISGTTVTDMTYRGNDGTLVSSPGTTIGRLGQAVSFNGTSQYVSVGNKNIIEDAAAASVCLWLKYNAPSVTADAGLLTKWDSEGWLMWVDDVAFTSGRTNTISFAVDASQSGPGRVEGSTNLVVPGEWAHYCGTFQGGSFIRLYKNGVLDRENTTSIVSVVDSNTHAIRIGDSANAGSIKYLNGEVDDVRIYNRALSADDVIALYELGERTKINTTQTPFNLNVGLVGHWTFDGPDMTTATATDVSGNGNDGVVATPSNLIRPSAGKVGQSLEFDGVTSGQVITVSADSSHENLSAYTISAWIKPGLSSNDMLMSKGFGSSNPDNGFLWRILSTGAMSFVYSYSTTDIFRSTASDVLTADEWNFVTVSWDGSATASNIKMYVNGVETSYVTSVNGSGSRVSDVGQSIRIANSAVFEGMVDDLRLYNRTLSADEVAQLYALGGGSKIKICRESSVQDADGNWYNTVAIGSQCWLDRNMDVGVRIPSFATAQTNNGTIEKYCYNDADDNCTTNNPSKPDGGLYQWSEAMQYSTEEGARGICPAGFHIPTDAEWHTLEKFLADSGQSCIGGRNGSQSCSSAGTKLLPGGSSRFEGNSGGFIDGGSSGDRGALGYWWSSTQSGGSAFNRAISASGASVYRLIDPITLAESVRCIQD